jgi:NAD(P)-dependent dehydrogenase (short-subunit alcohol dehydrogenase family)
MSTQIVLITGGLSGIGRAAAIAFAKKGAKVVLPSRRSGTALFRFGGRVHQRRVKEGGRPRSGRQDRRTVSPPRCRREEPAPRPDHRPRKTMRVRTNWRDPSMKHEVRVMQH